MKNLLIIIGLLFFTLQLAAQAPQGINYQSVLRGDNNSLLSNLDVNLRISILQDSITGLTVYQESHSKTTNQYGLTNLVIGKGTVIFGSFAGIHWGDSEHFIKIEADTTDGTQYYDMGTIQLLSVPYALFANEVSTVSNEDIVHWDTAYGWGNHASAGYLADYTETDPIARIRLMTTAQRDSILNPYAGMQIINSQTNCLNYYNGNNWYEVCGDCDPMPTSANAGPDQLNLINTTTNLAGNIPSEGTGLWTIVSGTGGIIDNPSVATSGFHGNVGNSYILQWTISNDCGSDSDVVTISFSSGSSCGQPLVDSRDGQSYNTVLIGTQCWMAENLNLGTMITSTTGGQLQTNNGTIEKYCYNNTLSYCETYGGLYEWNEAMQYVTAEGAQGICPVGWHIPTDNEFKILEGTVDSQYPVGDPEWDLLGWRGLDAGSNLKEMGTAHWVSPNLGATNEYGFTSLPGGQRYFNFGEFINLGYDCYFWTSSQINTTEATTHRPTYFYTTMYRSAYHKSDGFSIRCIKNN